MPGPILYKFLSFKGNSAYSTIDAGEVRSVRRGSSRFRTGSMQELELISVGDEPRFGEIEARLLLVLELLPGQLDQDVGF